jgi:hypothetical protein
MEKLYKTGHCSNMQCNIPTLAWTRVTTASPSKFNTIKILFR